MGLWATTLFFLSIFGLCIVSWSFDNHCIFPLLFKSETTGTIVEYVHNRRGETPAVTFSIPGRQQHTFQSPINRCYFNCKAGTSVTVVYDENFPEKAEIKNLWTLGFSALLLIFLFCCLCMLLKSVYLFVVGLLRQRDAPRLMQDGQRIMATITKIRDVGWWGNMNWVLPVITEITAQWKSADGTTCIFWDLVRKNTYKVGDPISVTMDPDNPKHYHMLLE